MSEIFKELCADSDSETDRIRQLCKKFESQSLNPDFEQISLLNFFEKLDRLSHDVQMNCGLICSTKGFVDFQNSEKIMASFVQNLNTELFKKIGNQENYSVCVCDVVYDSLVQSLEKLKKENSGSRTSICEHFTMNKCHFLRKCFNVHFEPCEITTIKRVVSDKVNDIVEDDTSGVDSIAGLTYKKRKLRTATDAINRINWDERFDIDDLIIGYMDRFLGVVEKPFASFNWEKDLSLLSHRELAIPKHRIQYLKLKSEIVWDKRFRIDKVFSSEDLN